MHLFWRYQSLCRFVFKGIRQEKEKAGAAGASDNRQTGRIPRKCFRCGSEYHLIEKFPKPPKDNEKRKKQVRFNKEGNRACYNRENSSDKKIYASMARMSGNYEYQSEFFCDSSQLINWILDSGATCQMTPAVSDFIPSSLQDTDKQIEVADGHHITAKQK